MKALTKNELIVSWSCQVVAAAILGFAGTMKLAGNYADILIFTAIEMGHFGRILIGLIEAGSALMLLTRSFPHFGALLGLATMLGAIIAHVTVLGFEIESDGGMHLVLLGLVVLTSSTVLAIRRRDLPLLGIIFD